ncbi:MAG: hypothetical protein V1921_05880 [Candidatus Altiarchaeota archaeon]
MSLKTFKKTVHWSLAALVVIYIVTGFGITQYRTVERLTGGLLTKSISFTLHNNIEIPFIILLVLHIYFTVFERGKDRV